MTWLDDIEAENRNILVVAEGLTMYLSEDELNEITNAIAIKFSNVTIVFDAYSKRAVKMSKLKKTVNQMNARIKWGINEPSNFIKLNENLEFVKGYLKKYIVVKYQKHYIRYMSLE